MSCVDCLVFECVRCAREFSIIGCVALSNCVCIACDGRPDARLPDRAADSRDARSVYYVMARVRIALFHEPGQIEYGRHKRLVIDRPRYVLRFSVVSDGGPYAIAPVYAATKESEFTYVRHYL